MTDGLLSLKWNKHKTAFFQALSTLYEKELYADVTLACDGKFYPVHKLVLSTCSDYFRDVFENTSCKSPVVILKDIRQVDIECLLKYMYVGEVDIKQTELPTLVKAAECLQIKGLAVSDEEPMNKREKRSRSTHEFPNAKKFKDANTEQNSLRFYSSQEHESNSNRLIPIETIKVEDEPAIKKPDLSFQEDVSQSQDTFPDESMSGDIELPNFKRDSSAGPSNLLKNDADISFGDEDSFQAIEEDYSNQDDVTAEKYSGVDSCKNFASSIVNCEICSKTLLRSSMRKHMQLHRRVKPYACEYCSYKTNVSGNLRNHLRTHTKEKPFKCNECTYEAAQIQALKAHMTTHIRYFPM